MLAAGMSHEDIVQAVADMEAAATPTRTARQERNARYYEKKASEKRLNKTDQDDSDGENSSSPDKENPPKPPKEINPNTNPPSAPKGASSPTEIDLAITAYTNMAERAGLPVPRKITDARRRKIGSMLKSYSLDLWREAVAAIEASDFCRGINDRGWRADLDFMLQRKSFDGLIEGKYANNPPRGSPPSRQPKGSDYFDMAADYFDERTGNLGSDTDHRHDAERLPQLAIQHDRGDG